MRTNKLLTLTALTVWTALMPAHGQPIYYTVTELGTLRTIDNLGNSEANAINDSGTIIGTAMCNSNQPPSVESNHAFRFKPGGTMEDIRLFGG